MKLDELIFEDHVVLRWKRPKVMVFQANRELPHSSSNNVNQIIIFLIFNRKLPF